jgi:hypothetical protein
LRRRMSARATRAGDATIGAPVRQTAHLAGHCGGGRAKFRIEILDRRRCGIVSRRLRSSTIRNHRLATLREPTVYNVMYTAPTAQQTC